MNDAPFNVGPVPPSLAGLGAVLDLISRSPPFAEFRLGRIATAVRRQLSSGHNLGAVDPSGNLVGYVGWAMTTEALAKLWVEGKGQLKIVDSADAAALTVVASIEPMATRQLIRAAREKNPNRRIFFKRGDDSRLAAGRKSSVLNTTGTKPD